MSKGTRDRGWVRVRGYNKMYSGNIAADGLNHIIVANECPSESLITIITHLGTYAGDLAAYGKCTWIAPNFWPFHAQQDQLGTQGQPLELSDQIELNPGIAFSLSGVNADNVVHAIGWVIRAEQGYYK